MREAPIGSAFSQFETISVTDNRFTVGIEACIHTLYETESADSRVGEVRCTTEFAQPSMTEALIGVAQQEEAEIDDNELDQGLIQAWEVTEYDFSSSDTQPFIKSSHFELQNSEGDTVWSSDSIEDTTGGPDTEELEVIEELFGEEMKSGDLTAIQAVLSSLGVPEEIVFID